MLDCLVFRNSATRDLAAAIEARRVEALVHRESVEELQRVLAYPQFKLSVTGQRQVLDRYLSATTLASMPEGFSREALLLPPGFPRCRDRDDEPFLALAWHARADALITKDKAVLKLRKKAGRFGVAIMTLDETLRLQITGLIGSHLTCHLSPVTCRQPPASGADRKARAG